MTESDQNLVIFLVGHIPCCVGSNSVMSVIEPPEHITAIPGSNAFRPGLFTYMQRAVAVYDVRTKFNLGNEQRGKIIISELNQQLFGFWVDSIQEIISVEKGRLQILPAECPKELFESLFILKDQLVFKTTFEALAKAQVSTRAHLFFKKLLDQSSKNKTKDIQQTKSAQSDNHHQVAEKTVVSNPVNTIKPELVKTEDQGNKTKTSLKAAAAIKPAITQSEHATGLKSTSQYSKPTTTIDKNNNRSNATFEVNPVTRENNKSRTPLANTTTHTANTETLLTSSENPNRVTHQPAASGVQTRNHHEQPGQSVTGTQLPAHDLSKHSKTETEASNSALSALLMLIVLLLIPGASLYWYLSDTTNETRNNRYSAIKNTKPVTSSTEIPETSTAMIIDEVPEQTSMAEKEPETLNQPTPATINQVPTIENDEPETPVENDSAIILQDENEITITISDPDAKLNLIKNEPEKIEPAISESQPTSQAVETLETAMIETDTSTEAIAEIKTSDITLKVTPKDQTTSTKKGLTEKVVHIVVKGDTLWHIAKRYIQDPFKYKQLARLSRIKNPDLIYPGNKVIIIIDRTKHDK